MITIRLKEIAEAKGFNQSQVQRQTGLTMGQVRRYWHNETEEVKLSALDKICALLDCEPGDLIKRVAVTTTETPDTKTHASTSTALTNVTHND